MSRWTGKVVLGIPELGLTAVLGARDWGDALVSLPSGGATSDGCLGALEAADRIVSCLNGFVMTRCTVKVVLGIAELRLQLAGGMDGECTGLKASGWGCIRDAREQQRHPELGRQRRSGDRGGAQLLQRDALELVYHALAL